MTWRGVVEAVNQELYPKLASAFGLSVESLLTNESLNLTEFDDDSVDSVIRVLKIKKKSLLNKEIDYIKGLVARMVQFNYNLQKEPKQKMHSDSINQNDSFFRYKEFNDIPDLDPDADLIPNPKWKGLTANLVVDI